MSFGSTPKDVSGIPISSVYVPNSGFIALKGSTNTNTDGSSNTSTGVSVSLEAQTVGGTSDYHLISAATTNAASIKGSAGQVYSYEITNTNAAFRYVKLYDKASAPTVGTDTPYRTIGVPPTGRVTGTFPQGLKFVNGIGIGTTTGIADNNSSAVGASDLSLDIDYI